MGIRKEEEGGILDCGNREWVVWVVVDVDNGQAELDTLPGGVPKALDENAVQEGLINPPSGQEVAGDLGKAAEELPKLVEGENTPGTPICGQVFQVKDGIKPFPSPRARVEGPDGGLEAGPGPGGTSSRGERLPEVSSVRIQVINGPDNLFFVRGGKAKCGVEVINVRKEAVEMGRSSVEKGSPWGTPEGQGSDGHGRKGRRPV